MSAPPSVPCAEPMPYSDDVSGYADIDFNVAPQAVFNMQPAGVPVDSILSKQLGPNTNPVTPAVAPYVNGFPILPEVGDNNAKPLLSSYNGTDISASMTLSNNLPNTMSVNDIVGNPSVTQPFTNVTVPEEVQHYKNVNNQRVPHKPTNSFAELTNIPASIMGREQFDNIKKGNVNKNTLAKFIDNNTNSNVEHFGKPKQIEHFFQMTLMDNIVLAIVLGAFIYYIVTLKSGNNLDTSKIPIVSQLSDKNVSTENKVIIVVAVVVACVLINRMMK